MRRPPAVIAALIAVCALVLAAVTVGAGSAGATTNARLTPARSHSLLVIGASYSAGWGATNPRLGYAHRLAAKLGWPATISAEPGAGYLSTGNNGHDSFLEQIRSLPSTLRPGLVLIQGGRDDIGRPAGPEARAVARTVAAVRARFGSPQIVLLGDVPASLPVAHDAVQMNDLLARVAAKEHAVFIDPIRQHWISAADAAAFRSAIPGHPNDAGHAYIAHRLALDLGAADQA